MIPRFLDAFDIDFFLVAMPYSLLEQSALDREFPMCLERGVGIVKGAPYASGVVASGAVSGSKHNYQDAPGDVVEKVRAIEFVCHRHEVPLRAAALQFLFGFELVASVIPGVNNHKEVASNVEIMKAEIPPDFWEELKTEGLLRADAPTP